MAKGRARLWEDSIVVALRDMQWMNYLNTEKSKRLGDGDPRLRGVVPPGFAKLDGNAESRIGDVTLLTEDERFFIFEVKSERVRIRDEWRKGGAFKPKKVYRRLSALVNDVNNEGLGKSARNLELSLRGHYFVYFNAAESNDGVAGTIFAEPYITGSIAHRTDAEKLVSQTMRPLREMKIGVVIKEKLLGRARLDFLFNHFAEISIGRGDYGKKHNVGLDKDEFSEYVNFLCHRSSHESHKSRVSEDESEGTGEWKDDEEWTASPEPLHMIVLSSSGAFFRAVSDTNHLAYLLDLKERPAPAVKKSMSNVAMVKPAYPAQNGSS